MNESIKHPQRPKLQVRTSNRNAPPRPTPIDMKIAHYGGSTVALEATRGRLRQSKQMPIANPLQRIEELLKENAQLRQEVTNLAYTEEEANLLLGKVMRGYEMTRNAVLQFEKFQRELREEQSQRKEQFEQQEAEESIFSLEI